MGIISDYQFYLTEYHGSMSESEFTKHSVYAEALINEFTFGRAKENVCDEVKLALCTACDIVQSDSVRRVQGAKIASENTDGYSVSYSTDRATAEGALKAEILERVKTYLAPTGLMNWGVYE